MSTTVRWSPRRELVSLREAMERLLDEDIGDERVLGRGEARLPIDVYTTPAEIVITAAVPGLSPEEVEVTLENEMLTIRGELPLPLENVEYIFQERPYGRFSRALTLNVPIDVDNVEATFENGLLTLTLPKAVPTKPKTIKVKVKS
jgi:HSP20 family protein